MASDKGLINACFRLCRRRFELNVDLQISDKGITAVMGESGSGKTTLLRCLAGLDKPSDGLLTVNEVIWQDEETCLPTHKRPIGYVFQEASLFSHLTALENLQYAIKRAPNRISGESFERVVNTMGIKEMLDQCPDQLSGGERQRVAIARALLIQPELMLMDEPLASLDAKRKQEILPYLERLHETLDVPLIYVSHSVEEVSRLADHVVLLESGQVIAQGNLQEVFSRLDLPTSVDAEAGVVLQGTVVEHDKQWHLVRVQLDSGELWISDSKRCPGDSVRVRILARDVSLALGVNDDMSILNRLHAEVVDVSENPDNAAAMLRLKVGDDYLLARVTRKSVANLGIKPGIQLWAQIKSVAIVR